MIACVAFCTFVGNNPESADLPDEALRVRPGKVRGPRAAPVARLQRPAPRPSRQYAGRMSSTVFRDRRLSPRAASLAALLVAQAGNGLTAMVTRTYLARTLQVSTRTIARLLSDLEHCGYIQRRHRVGPRGEVVGLAIELCDSLLPYFECGPP